MIGNPPSNAFAIALAECQSKLYGYIMALSLDRNVADDILQATNLALCEHAGKYPDIRDFTAWACKTAHLKLLEYRKSHQRDRLLFDNDLIQSIAEEATASIDDFSIRQRFLRDCLMRLSERHRKMILRRYGENGAVDVISSESGRPVKSIYQILYRIRSSLLDCVNRKLGKEAQG
jgi:RNA polymerase sigma-70 factor (ECF subfamily)